MTPSYSQWSNKMVSAANGVDYAFRELGARWELASALTSRGIARRLAGRAEPATPHSASEGGSADLWTNRPARQ